MQYPFIKKDEELKKYLFNLKEVCIIEHEDNWFKEKTHTKIYHNIEDAKAKIGRPHYWILNAIDEYEESDNQEEAMIALAILVFKSNYYSQKLTSETENEEAKKDLVSSLRFLNITDAVIATQVVSMDTPKYARFDMSEDDALDLISSWD